MGDKSSGETPEEIAARHERIQQEARDRKHTEGGLTVDDRLAVIEQERQKELNKFRGGPAPSEGLTGDDRIAIAQESILDEIDHSHATTGVMGLGPDESAPLTEGMLAAIRQPKNQLWLVGTGLGVILLFALFMNKCNGQEESPTTQGSTSTSAGSTTTEAVTQSPVTGTATATALLTKVSGVCNFAVEYEDTYSYVVTAGAMTLTQLSNNHVTTGTMEATGEFTTMAEGQSYTGRVTGTTAEGVNTYTADGCNEIYNFVMQLSAPLIP
ncbi:MAG: hypothetical protein A2135_07040 [Actinobacteria bacterium RBG_16_67_15]|nr:MAG: hypothetical protein A2135_07040 [Actinobacteria bacterium RBG_16_67_15]